MPYYADTSALMKLVAREAESAAFGAWLERVGGDVLASELVRVELLRSVRKRDASKLSRTQEILKLTPLLSVSPDIIENAGLLDPISLRSLDAIHLASALSLGVDLDGMVTYDMRLAEAARLTGVPVFAPA